MISDISFPISVMIKVSEFSISSGAVLKNVLSAITLILE